jgi:hypothetical protein
MDLRTTLWAGVLALGCSTSPNDTDPTTEDATSGGTTSAGTTDGPTTTGGQPVTTGQATTGPDGDDTTSGTASDTGEEASPECVLYCDEFMPNCGAIPDVERYDDMADCLATCAVFAHGPDGEFMGDTVECRIAHLTFDPEKPPGYYETHCFHAQEHPTANCV